MTDSNATLLPCPFCGGEAFPNIELRKHWVECRECAAESGCYRTEAEAIAAWNTRAGRGECEPKWTLQSTTQTQEFWRCDCGNCGECFGMEDRQSFPFKITVDKVKTPNYCPNCGVKVVKR